jgi:hypothetical protein
VRIRTAGEIASSREMIAYVMATQSPDITASRTTTVFVCSVKTELGLTVRDLTEFCLELVEAG